MNWRNCKDQELHIWKKKKMQFSIEGGGDQGPIQFFPQFFSVKNNELGTLINCLRNNSVDIKTFGKREKNILLYFSIIYISNLTFESKTPVEIYPQQTPIQVLWRNKSKVLCYNYLCSLKIDWYSSLWIRK